MIIIIIYYFYYYSFMNLSFVLVYKKVIGDTYLE